jgi:hypothetical protein
MEINYEWVKAQFAESKVKIGVGKAVLKMLETWETIDMPDAMAQEALEVLAKVGMGHSIAPEKKDEVWVDARRGDLKVGEHVRVKNNAFTGTLGATNNGRRGTISAIRSGDIIVKMNDGKLPEIDGGHYQPEVLQKRVR